MLVKKQMRTHGLLTTILHFFRSVLKITHINDICIPSQCTEMRNVPGNITFRSNFDCDWKIKGKMYPGMPSRYKICTRHVAYNSITATTVTQKYVTNRCVAWNKRCARTQNCPAHLNASNAKLIWRNIKSIINKICFYFGIISPDWSRSCWKLLFVKDNGTFTSHCQWRGCWRPGDARASANRQGFDSFRKERQPIPTSAWLQITMIMGPHMGPTWVLSAPDGPHVCPMNLAIRENLYALISYVYASGFCVQGHPLPTEIS